MARYYPLRLVVSTTELRKIFSIKGCVPSGKISRSGALGGTRGPCPLSAAAFDTVRRLAGQQGRHLGAPRHPAGAADAGAFETGDGGAETQRCRFIGALG
jgi:hypothetical protein